MKKTQLLSIALSTLIASSAFFSNAAYSNITQEKAPYNAQQSIMRPTKQEMKKRFEERLNLSEKQKEKARIIHLQGREQIKPIMMQIDLKRQEIETVKLSRIAEKMQQEKITQLLAEIKELEKKAHDIRKQNSQEFEKILTKKQKTELEQMKAEGRARFEREHHPRPPFQGLGTPNFLLKPILPLPGDSPNWK